MKSMAAALMTEVLGRKVVSGSVHCRPMYTESGRLCGYRARGSLFITVIIHNVSYSATLFRVGRIEDLV